VAAPIPPPVPDDTQLSTCSVTFASDALAQVPTWVVEAVSAPVVNAARIRQSTAVVVSPSIDTEVSDTDSSDAAVWFHGFPLVTHPRTPMMRATWWLVTSGQVTVPDSGPVARCHRTVSRVGRPPVWELGEFRTSENPVTAPSAAAFRTGSISCNRIRISLASVPAGMPGAMAAPVDESTVPTAYGMGIGTAYSRSGASLVDTTSTNVTSPAWASRVRVSVVEAAIAWVWGPPASVQFNVVPWSDGVVVTRLRTPVV
jgi:hypothetical protein